ncbi:MAG: MG2 domain-containing protein, partial [Pseudomonadota bacterium]
MPRPVTLTRLHPTSLGQQRWPGLIAAALLTFAATAPGAQTAFADATAPKTFQHPPSQAAGDRYAAFIKRSWTAKGRSANAWIAVAAKRRARGDRGNALTGFYAGAVAASPTSAKAWLGIARSLAEIPEADLKGAARGNTRTNAAGAAFNAFRYAKQDGTRAEALTALGDILTRQSYWQPAIAALKASLTYRDASDVRARYDELRRSHGFRVVNYRVEADRLQPRLCIDFSEPLEAKPETYAEFVSLDGVDAATIAISNQQLCVPGLSHGSRAALTLREGMPARGGDTLAKTATLNVYVRDRRPSVRFTRGAYVLPKAGQNGIPVSTVNTRKLDVTLYRIGDRSLAQAAANGQLRRELGQWDLQEIEKTSGRKVFKGSVTTRYERNREVMTAVPIASVLPARAPGVYVLAAAASGAEANNETRQPATQWFVISDLGLTTVTAKSGLHVFVRSLAAATPTGSVKLKVIARNNEVLAEAATNAQGYAQVAAAKFRGEGGGAPALLIAETDGGDFAYLDLTRPAFDLTDRGVKGRNAPGAIDGFLYTERGVYRAGETAHVSALVRTSDGAAANLPATLIVSRPDGVEYRRITLRDQGDGGRTHALQFDAAAMTGTWRMRLHVDPEAPAIAETAVLVEDFVPERLGLDLTTTAKTITPGEAVEIDVTGRYLYGPPA